MKNKVIQIYSDRSQLGGHGMTTVAMKRVKSESEGFEFASEIIKTMSYTEGYYVCWSDDTYIPLMQGLVKYFGYSHNKEL